MSFGVVVLLSVLWVGFFLPGLIKTRRSSPYASAATFQECLTRISTGRAVDADQLASRPRRRLTRRQIARRRDTVLGLTGAVMAAGTLALSLGGAAVWLIMPPLLALGGYLAVLRMEVVRASEHHPPVMSAGSRSRAAAPAEPVVPSVGRRGDAQERTLERIAG